MDRAENAQVGPGRDSRFCLISNKLVDECKYGVVTLQTSLCGSPLCGSPHEAARSTSV